MNDALGGRMKGQYEDRTRFSLPRRTNTILRLDGKAFHSYTRGRDKPWDSTLHMALVRAARALCEEAHGAVLTYVQSDEISVLLTDYKRTTTEAWFDGNVQKMVSVAASVVTAEFNRLEGHEAQRAHFDARAFTIPDPVEVYNYFVWRQKDAERNSVMALAQSHWSHKKLQGKNRTQQHDLIHEAEDNWNDWPDAFKRGSVVTHETGFGWLWNPAPIFTQTTFVQDILAGCQKED